jgi:O-antigen ligase
VALFLWTVIAASYSEAPTKFVQQDLYKYKKLLLAIPLIYYLTPKIKFEMLAAYVCGVFMLIALSFAKGGHGLMHLIQYGQFAYTDSFRIYISEGMHYGIALFVLGVGLKQLPKFRLHIGGLMIILLTHVVFMNGRMGLLSLIMSLLLTVFWSLPNLKTRVTTLMFTVACGYVLFLSSPLIQIRVMRTLDEAWDFFTSDEPTSIRFQYFKISWELFKQQPLTGTGPGSFHAATTATGKDGAFVTYIHTHNEFLTLLSQYGLIGLGIFAAILVAMRYQLLLIENLDERRIGLAALIIFLLNSLTDSMVYMEGYLFVFILALGHSYCRAKDGLIDAK